MKFLYHFDWWLYNLIVVLNVKCAISNMLKKFVHGISRHEMQKNYNWKNKTGSYEQRAKWHIIIDFWHLNYYKKTLYAIKNCFTYFRTSQLQQTAKNFKIQVHCCQHSLGKILLTTTLLPSTNPVKIWKLMEFGDHESDVWDFAKKKIDSLSFILKIKWNWLFLM